MADFRLWDEFVDRQARAFCAHAESSPRLKELASHDYNDLSDSERQELLRLFDYAAISFDHNGDDEWWR